MPTSPTRLHRVTLRPTKAALASQYLSTGCLAGSTGQSLAHLVVGSSRLVSYGAIQRYASGRGGVECALVRSSEPGKLVVDGIVVPSIGHVDVPDRAEPRRCIECAGSNADAISALPEH